MTKKVYLIRHAESVANKTAKRAGGESPLTEEGIKQAQMLAKRLVSFGIETIYSSPMKRAMQTAKTISSKIGVSVFELPEATERRYPSILLGLDKNSDEAKEYYSAYKRAFMQGDTFSDGETFQEFKNRVIKTAEILANSAEENLALVTHEFFKKAFIAYVLKGENFTAEDVLNLYDNSRIFNTGITHLQYTDGKWKLLYVNDTTHLSQDKVSAKYKPKVVTIGGGTGQFTLLSGLKHFPLDITAIVSMADDGGTTGVLRDELGALPPTDVRKCLVALSSTTPTLRELFTYRFPNKNLEGHTIGNLLLTALEKITGDFSKAIEEASAIFNIKGKVLPVTKEDMRLKVELNNGEILSGEKMLDENPRIFEFGVKKISLANPVKINPHAKEAIEEADVIVIGPGDLYGSVLPNFLVDGIKEALQKTKATIIFVSNLTNKRGQTSGFSACDYVDVLHKYLQTEVVDILLCNSQEADENLKKRYREQEGEGMFVRCSTDCHGIKVVKANLLSESVPEIQKGDTLAHTRSFIRHDQLKLAKEIVAISEQVIKYRFPHKVLK